MQTRRQRKPAGDENGVWKAERNFCPPKTKTENPFANSQQISNYAFLPSHYTLNFPTSSASPSILSLFFRAKSLTSCGRQRKMFERFNAVPPAHVLPASKTCGKWSFICASSSYLTRQIICHWKIKRSLRPIKNAAKKIYFPGGVNYPLQITN